MGADLIEYPLIENGENIQLTVDNKDLFISKLIQYKLNEFNTQLTAIKHGLSSVIPLPVLSVVHWEELELLVCGKAKIDGKLLKANTVYEGCAETDPFIQYFWEVFNDRFTDQDRSDFIKFVWGRARLPTSSTQFKQKFKIAKLPVKSTSTPDSYLPVSHTCFMALDLPAYTSVDAMYSKLLYATRNCVAIDADNTVNAQQAASMSNTME